MSETDDIAIGNLSQEFSCIVVRQMMSINIQSGIYFDAPPIVLMINRIKENNQKAGQPNQSINYLLSIQNHVE